jgi:hypothetical protein
MQLLFLIARIALPRAASLPSRQLGHVLDTVV